MSDNIKMIAKTLAGLEEVLSTELQSVGAKNIEKLNRAVAFEGSLETLYLSNYLCRTALRILIPIKTFQVRNQDELYREMMRIDWSQYLSATDTISIDSVANASAFTNSMFVSMKAKDAIVDQFRNKTGERPSVDTLSPDLRINIHIYKEDCTLSLDSSGNSLHKRGYRVESNKAPLNEVLGAGLVLLSGWDKKKNLIDPMCGSGTLLTEACMYAKNIPPGYFRKEFGFQRWKGIYGYRPSIWSKIVEDANKKIVPLTALIKGSDSARSSVSIVKTNLKSAGIREEIDIQFCDFADTKGPEGGGVVIMNPPYGERMDKDDIGALYKSIGDTLKKEYQGYDAWIISSNKEAINNIGLKTSRRIVIYNGPLECRFLKYELYGGTRKIRTVSSEE